MCGEEKVLNGMNDLNLPLLAEFPINHDWEILWRMELFEEYVYNNNTYDSIVDTFLKNLNK